MILPYPTPIYRCNFDPPISYSYIHYTGALMIFPCPTPIYRCNYDPPIFYSYIHYIGALMIFPCPTGIGGLTNFKKNIFLFLNNFPEQPSTPPYYFFLAF